MKGIPAKINLILFNPWPGAPYECSDWGRIEKFSDIVFDAGYASPVRTPRPRYFGRVRAVEKRDREAADEARLAVEDMPPGAVLNTG